MDGWGHGLHTSAYRDVMYILYMYDISMVEDCVEGRESLQMADHSSIAPLLSEKNFCAQIVHQLFKLENKSKLVCITTTILYYLHVCTTETFLNIYINWQIGNPFIYCSSWWFAINEGYFQREITQKRLLSENDYYPRDYYQIKIIIRERILSERDYYQINIIIWEILL